MKNKRGTAGSQNWPTELFGFYLPFIFVVSLAAILFAFSITNKASAKTRISEDVEILNLMQRFLESPDCFIMISESIVSSGVIDASKFNEDRLNSCYKVGNANYIAFKLRLKSTSQLAYEKEIRGINWNDNRPPEKKMSRQVLIFLEGKTVNGELSIEI